MWLRHDSFSDFVTRVWNSVISGNPLQIYSTYCARFQYLTRNRNRSIFGDLFQNITNLHNTLQVVQQNLHASFNPAIFYQEQAHSAKLFSLFAAEEYFWAQRARVN